MGIAGNVLEAVRAEVALRPGHRVTRAALRIGELSGVEPESLRFCLEVLAPEIHFDFEKSPGSELDLMYLELEEP